VVIVVGSISFKKRNAAKFELPEKVSRQKPGKEKLGIKAQRVLSNGQ
jgi:hypothetical protein